MTDIFDVVSDATRRDIMGILLAQSLAGRPELSVSDLVGLTGATQPTVSKQLKVLRDAGLVLVREDGQHRYYRIDATPLSALAEWVGAFEATSSRATSKPATGTRTTGAGASTSSGESLASEDARLVATSLGAAAASALFRAREAFDDIRVQARDMAERISEQMRR